MFIGFIKFRMRFSVTIHLRLPQERETFEMPESRGLTAVTAANLRIAALNKKHLEYMFSLR